jgi:uncharacterized protein (DUF362 family)
MAGAAPRARVAVWQGESRYPDAPPFHPSAGYAEYPFGDAVNSSGNPAYAGVRETLRLLGLDAGRYGTAAWNPLGELIAPGNTVLLKPNLIRESNLRDPASWQEVITNGAVVRAVLDYTFIALQGKGRVIIADGPQTDSDFEAICRHTGLPDLVTYFEERGLDVVLRDLRRDRWFQQGDVIYDRVTLEGDPAGYATVDIGGASEFEDYRLSGNFYGADYDMSETARFHSAGKHTYILCRSAMDADVIINLPKLKTHKKTGVTLSLKNMVGVNGYRNCLPHHTTGTPKQNGDEFPGELIANYVQSRLTVAFKRVLVLAGGRGGAWARGIKLIGMSVFGRTESVIRSGNWHGNDTAWRMVLDLNKALFHFDGEGRPRTKPLRYLSIVDGIVAGDCDGPAAPDPVAAGVIVAGLNPVCVDTVCATIMGFDFGELPMLARAWEIEQLPLVDHSFDELECASNVDHWNVGFAELRDRPHLGFRPHFGWTGHVERDDGALATR